MVKRNILAWNADHEPFQLTVTARKVRNGPYISESWEAKAHPVWDVGNDFCYPSAGEAIDAYAERVSKSCRRRGWDKPPSEPLPLADGVADQTLIPGVAPVPLTTRQLEAERQRRDTRRTHAPLPCGGLWDETAQRQQELF